jgi:hypothetical protein
MLILQTVEGCARRDAVYTRGQTCAPERVARAVQGASVFRRGPQGTENCVGGATRT